MKRWSDREKGEERDGEAEKEKEKNPLQSVLYALSCAELAEASVFHLFTFQKAVLLQNDSS
jgi:hypothetical protein